MLSSNPIIANYLMQKLEYPYKPISINSIKDAVSDLNNLKLGRKEREKNQFSYWWGRGQQYISLVNILLNKECVKELIQNDLNPKKLSFELNRLFDSKNSKKIALDYKKINDLLYQKNTSKKIAADILS